MKVNSSSSGFSKNKSALSTTSKLLKPKKFKVVQKNVKDLVISKEKLQLALTDSSINKKSSNVKVNSDTLPVKRLEKVSAYKKKSPGPVPAKSLEKVSAHKKKSPDPVPVRSLEKVSAPKKKSPGPVPAKSLEKVSAHKKKSPGRAKKTRRTPTQKSHEKTPEVSESNTKINSSTKQSKKNVRNTQKRKNKKRNKKSKNKLSGPKGKLKKKQIKPFGELAPSKLNSDKVSAAVSSLLKLVRQKPDSEAELLNIAGPIFMQVECIKIPICPKKQLRFKLPHPLVSESSDVLLIIADKKGSKIYPEEAIDHCFELLAKHHIHFIDKVLPLRMLRHEYSQFEMRKKLIEQYDMVLADANIIKSLPRLLGKFICYKRKMPITVHLDRKNLKQHLQIALSKTQMTVKSNGHMFSVQVGHSQMDVSEITANIIEISKYLAETFPGGWQNIRSLNIKTQTSPSLPVYLSLLSPNMVRIPVEQPKKKPPIEDELSTMPGRNVVVLPNGTVFLKKVAEEDKVDDSKDDEILLEAEKYIQSSRTVRYGESDDDDGSDKEADAITAAVEQEFLNDYKSTKEAAGSEEEEEGEEEEEEEEESSEEEETVVPTLGKKRKMGPVKKQTGNLLNKKQKKAPQTQNVKDNSSQVSHKGTKPGSATKGGVQKRGTRGGKKNKMNKDQRKAMIKQKKAGKKTTV